MNGIWYLEEIPLPGETLEQVEELPLVDAGIHVLQEELPVSIPGKIRTELKPEMISDPFLGPSLLE